MLLTQVGAIPSKKVHHFLTLVDLLPKKPVPLSSAYTYKQPIKTYPETEFHRARWGVFGGNLETDYFENKEEEMKELIDKKVDIHKEALDQ